MEVSALLYALDFKLNRVSNSFNQFIPDEDKLMAINEAQLRLLKKKTGLNNLYRSGLDSFKVRRSDLQKFIVSEDVVVDKNDDISCSVDLSKLKGRFFVPVDVSVLGKKGSCGERILRGIVVRHDDLPVKYSDPNYEPSFEYEETLYDVSDNRLNVYKKGFDIERVRLRYLRYPKPVDKAGYIHFDGSVSVDSDCELPEHLIDELLELAVMELASNTDDVRRYESANAKSLNSE